MKNDVWLTQGLAGEAFDPSAAEAPGRSPLLDALVMMVDDESLMTELIQTHLEDAGYRRFIVTNEPRDALALMQQRNPDVLLLDLMMPGLSGFDLLAQLRADPALRFTPVIVLTAAAGADTKLRALQLGATDFLSKPVDASELVLRLRNTLAFKQYHDHRADTDASTGLPNARAFQRHLRRALARCVERGGRLALLNVTVPETLPLRESLGPAVADQLMRSLAERLLHIAHRRGVAELLAPGDEPAPAVVRLGDDAFGLLLVDLQSTAEAELVARAVVSELAATVMLGRHECLPTPCVGIAIGPVDGARAELLQKAAELARTQARLRGGQRHEFFAVELNARLQARLQLGSELRHAVARGELRLHYQPKVDLASARVVGVEALVRWAHPVHGLMAPGLFIGLAEELGLIAAIGDWVIGQACEDAMRWSALGVADLTVAVNVAKPQFDSGRLCDTLRAHLARHRMPPQRLVLELTKSMLMTDAAAALQQMHELRALGVALSIDDFGTGYSSLAYLKSFPLCELKIDRSFVMDLPGSERDVAIVRSVAALGRDLGLSVLAEGVETVAQRETLRAVGCDCYQGFLFSRPLDGDGLLALLRRV